MFGFLYEEDVFCFAHFVPFYMQDKYKRSLADTENMRKRLTKQIEDAKLFGIQGFCKDLLTVSDILQKATECVPAEELKTNSPLKNLYEGLTMTEAELQKVTTPNEPVFRHLISLCMELRYSNAMA